MKRSAKKFITKEFPELSEGIIKDYIKIEEELKANEKELLTNSQYKRAVSAIFPILCMYKALVNYVDKEQAKEYADQYFNAGIIPFAKIIEKITKSALGIKFLKNILSKMLTDDTWDTTLNKNSDGNFDFDITRCLYKDLCYKYDSKELAPVFCAGDYVVFGHMKKLSFSRSETLGEGGNKCDFHFTDR